MPNRADTATEAREQRHTQLQERISNMSEESVKEILHTVCIRQPSFILNILEESSNRSESPKNPTENQPSWCRCTYCRDMPTDEEKVCCNPMPQNCHSRLPDFQTVVLDELVLEIAMRYRDDILAQPHDDNYNRVHRHTAYRQCILWIHGYLGAGNRRVIPSCCVWKIRDKYPDPFGQYIGFIGGRLG